VQVQDLFRQAGLDPRRGPGTWEALASYSKTIHAKTGKYGYGLVAVLNNGNTPFPFCPVMWAYGGSIFDELTAHPTWRTVGINAPGTVAALVLYNRMYCVDKSIPPSALSGLTPLLNQRPRQLSGGQQRVALGRALIRRPKLFLMDESLSNLDATLRVQMRAEIKRLHRQFPITTIYVTHDQSEAMTLSDRVVVMNHGVIVQVGRPAEIYERPINRFVADFVGLPAMNFLPVTLRAADRAVECVLETGCVAARVGLDEPSVPVAATLGVRPSRVRWSPAAVDDAGVRAIVREVDVQGEETLIYAQVGASALTILEREGRLPAVGDELTITLPSEAIYLFDPESGRILALRDQTPVVSSQGTAPALVSRAP
jgi:ABC-type proline/glycine betaine transport system ATPase subunit